jgi:predicted short-subunit dehydrogenase-like oxidoreductase (DUF2520 family)
MRVNLIGAGRVGRTILRLCETTSGFSVGGVVTRDYDRVQKELGPRIVMRTLSELQAADLWCMAVPDDAIARVAGDLASAGHAPSVAVHFSGYHAASVMGPLVGWSHASAHPNLSFTDPVVAAARFRGTHVALEGDSEAVQTAEVAMRAFGATCFRIGAAEKPMYHAAAVIANNFPIVLQGLAREVWGEAGVPEDVARDLGMSLLRSAVVNLEVGSPAEVLTGPAARGDSTVVDVEASALGSWRPEAGELYAALSRMAVRLKRDGRAGN